MIMDEWGDDAYDVIYDERDRERTVSPSNASSGCLRKISMKLYSLFKRN